MKLPVNPPLLPMLAKRADTIPLGDGWIFEPKWDGFRVLVFRDGDEVLIQSRDEKPLSRFFPELRAPLVAHLPERCVLDGEVVVAHGGALDFEALTMRIHPAASRIERLARECPASIVFWDLLCLNDDSLMTTPFHLRRGKLEQQLGSAQGPIHITPATRDRDIASDWFRRFEGAGLDGVIAKDASGAYEPNKRVMWKVKHERECDCVVAGFRWYKDSSGEEVGSLLLGLFDGGGRLHHVGVVASFGATMRRQLAEILAPYRNDAIDGHPWQEWMATHSASEASGGRTPTVKSRWSQGKDLSWEPVRAEMCVQVAYDHMQGSRFRHTAQFRRWRPDKAPPECTFAQLEVVAPHELETIFRLDAPSRI